MAEEDKENSEEQAPKKKLPLVPILMGGLSLLMVGALAVLAHALFIAQKPQISQKDMTERAIASIQDNADMVETFSLDKFSVNLDGKHVLTATIDVEVSNAHIVSVLKKRLPAIQAKIIEVLAGQPSADTRSFQGKLRLKDSIREAINNELEAFSSQSEGVVREVYFVEFILI